MTPLWVYLFQCRDLTHYNLCKFIGASLETDQPFILTEYCPKGSLQVLRYGFLMMAVLDL